MTTLRAFDRKPLAGVTHTPYRAELGRAMTAKEAWLNDLAQTEAFSGLVAIWHEGKDGTLTGFTALLPDVGRMAFVGTVEGE